MESNHMAYVIRYVGILIKKIFRTNIPGAL